MTTRRELQHANAHFVSDRLLVGGDLDLFDTTRAVRQRAELVDAGVTHVVDCRIEWDDAKAWRGTGVHYRRAPIDDAGQRVPAQWFEAEVGRVLAWLEDPDAVVLTHCHMGVNRGPSLGFAVLLGLGLEPVEALRAVQTARPIAYAYYAEDAVEWWVERQGLEPREADAHREALAKYREDQRLDVVHVIADIRSAERDAGPASWDA
jgi:hypothetical protein